MTLQAAAGTIMTTLRKYLIPFHQLTLRALALAAYVTSPLIFSPTHRESTSSTNASTH